MTDELDLCDCRNLICDCVLRIINRQAVKTRSNSSNCNDNNAKLSVAVEQLTQFTHSNTFPSVESVSTISNETKRGKIPNQRQRNLIETAVRSRNNMHSTETSFEMMKQQNFLTQIDIETMMFVRVLFFFSSLSTALLC